MVDEAPPAPIVLPELADLMRDRVLVAHSAAFDRRVLAQAFERAGVAWPAPPVLCTVALARRLHPLARQRKLAPLAESLGIEVEVTHRALADAETCARVFCALFPRLCAHAPTVADALALLRPSRPSRRRARADRRRPGARPRRAPPDARPLAPHRGARRLRRAQRRRAGHLRRQVGARALARPGALRAVVDRERLGRAGRDGRARAHGLRARRAAAREPAGAPPAPARQRAPESDPDRYVYLRCRLDIAFPVLEVANAPAEGRACPSARCAGARPPSSCSSSSTRCSACATAGAAAAAPVAARLRPDGALPVAVPGRPRPEPLPPAPRRGPRAVLRARRRRRGAAGPRRCADARGRGGRALRARRMAAPPARAPELAAGPPRARWRRRTRGRGSCSPRTPGGTRHDALWLVGGRVVDWGPLGGLDDVAERTRAALRGGDGTGTVACLSPDEVSEARIVSTWLDRNPSPALDLTGARTASACAGSWRRGRRPVGVRPAQRGIRRPLDAARTAALRRRRWRRRR